MDNGRRRNRVLRVNQTPYVNVSAIALPSLGAYSVGHRPGVIDRFMLAG
jgi:hypothetical protein